MIAIGIGLFVVAFFIKLYFEQWPAYGRARDIAECIIGGSLLFSILFVSAGCIKLAWRYLP